MIPVGTTAIPAHGRELAAGVAAALREVLALPEQQVRVDAEISAQNHVDHLSIDLSHAVIDTGHLRVRPWRPPAPQGGVATTLAALGVSGVPLVMFGAPVAVQMEASNVPSQWVHDHASRLWLVFTDTRSPAGPAAGKVLVDGEVGALTSAVETVAVDLARQRGLGIRDVQVAPRTVGENRWQVEVRATVTKGFLSSRVDADIQLHVDPALVLHVERLAVHAGGVLGKIAEGIAEAHLRRWHNQRIALTQRAFAGARLTGLDVDLDGRFRLAATLG